MKQALIDLYNKLKQGVLRTLSANVINKIVGMISSMIITRLLTQAEYGIWSYTLNIYSYLTLVTGFGLISGALQFGTENHGKGDAYKYFKYCVKNGLLIDSGLIFLVGFGVCLFTLPIEEAKLYIIAVLPILLFEYVLAIGQSALRSQNRIKEYANALNVNSISIAVGTCGGALFGVTGVVIGRYLANVISLLYLTKLLKHDVQRIKNAGVLQSPEKKQLWHYSLYTGASAAMNCLVYSLDITLIAALIKNATEVGIYRVGTLIPNALQFIPSSVVVAILPNVIYNRQDIVWVRRNVKKTFLGLTVCNAIISGGIILFSPLIIRIVSGSKYMASVPVLRILTLGYFFSGTFRTLSVNLLAAFRRVKYGLFISIMSCISDVILNYFLINNYGMIGAAYATLLVDILTAILSFTYVMVLQKRGTINEVY